MITVRYLIIYFKRIFKGNPEIRSVSIDAMFLMMDDTTCAEKMNERIV